MNGFNPDVKVGLYGEAQFIDREQEKPTTEQKLANLSESERQELLQDALAQYSDLESLIHAITAMETQQQDTLF